MSEISSNQLRELISKWRPLALPTFDTYFSQAEEVILIGSGTTGKLGPDSDIDILFIGKGPRFKKLGVDFIWVAPERTRSNSWLGSEMAVHAASFGKWAKGNGAWKIKIYYGETALRFKSERILVRLVKLYNLRNKVTSTQLTNLLLRSLLDIQRLILLKQQAPPPPATALLSLAIEAGPAILEDCCSDDLLGKLGKTLLFEVFNFNPVFIAAAQVLKNRTNNEISLW